MNTKNLIPISYVKKFTPLVVGDVLFDAETKNEFEILKAPFAFNTETPRDKHYFVISFADRPNTDIPSIANDVIIDVTRDSGVIDVMRADECSWLTVHSGVHWSTKSWKPNHAAMLKQWQAEQAEGEMSEFYEKLGVDGAASYKSTCEPQPETPIFTQGRTRSLYLGVGDRCGIKVTNNGVKIKSYKVWHAMLDRCYSDALRCNNPTYSECSVCDEWLLFSEFKKWFDENHIEGFQLDKDLTLIGNKLYCPEFCSFIPSEINSLLVNAKSSRGDQPLGVSFHKASGKFISRVRISGEYVNIGLFASADEAFNEYKIAKEAYIKISASKSYSLGQISERVYENLMAYSVVDDREVKPIQTDEEKAIDALAEWLRVDYEDHDENSDYKNAKSIISLIKDGDLVGVKWVGE